MCEGRQTHTNMLRRAALPRFAEFLSAFVLVHITFSPATASECFCDTPSVRLGLSELYHATGGLFWNTSSNWLNSSTSVCDWYGISCWGALLELHLEWNNVTGTLPPQLGSLLANQVFRFNLHENNLVGTLPPEYSLWGSSIRHFRVGLNKLSGTIPSEYATWTNLLVFHVNENSNINGTLPDTFSVWSSLVSFAVFRNQLSGTLPLSVLAAWTKLDELLVDKNRLSGTLSINDFKTWTTLLRFHICANNFTGDFFGTGTSEVIWPRLLSFCIGEGNRFTGTLPQILANWSLRYFDVSENNFSGTLPAEFSSWSQMCEFKVGHNSFSGALPASYAAWRCTPYGTVFGTTFNVEGNQLSGTLPSGYSDWSHVKHFEVAQNAFTGTLPSAYAVWGAELLIFISGVNALLGTLPPEYSAWSGLTNFDVSSNSMSGTLPPEYASWSYLNNFIVNNNYFTSSLPSEYGLSWSSMHTFSVAHNMLSGSVPSSYASMPANALLLNDNQISGTLPQLPVLIALGLHNNRDLRGSLVSVAVKPTMFVSVCNTSLCGSTPPLWLLSVFFCQSFENSDVRSRQVIVVPVSPSLPSCPGAGTPHPSSMPPTPRPTNSSSVIDKALTITTSSAAQALTSFAVAASASGAGGALQVSTRVALADSKIAACKTSSSINNDAAEVLEVGATTSDSPTQMVLSGRLPLTKGAVVGNTLLIFAVPVTFGGLAGVAVRARGSGELPGSSCMPIMEHAASPAHSCCCYTRD